MRNDIRTKAVAESSPSLFLTTAALCLTMALATSLPAQTPRGARPGWHGVVGVAAGSLGDYYGSDARRNLPVPLVSLAYRDRITFGASTSNGLGAGLQAYLLRGRFDMALGVAGAERRRDSRADALAGMEDRSGATYGTVAVGAHAGPLTATATTAIGLTTTAGAMQTFALDYSVPVARRLSARLTGAATFADRENMAFDFGVTEEQAERRRELLGDGDTRLRPGDTTAYTPSGGLKELRGTMQLAYELGDSWHLVGVASAGNLGMQAWRSPLARQRATLTSALGLAFAF